METTTHPNGIAPLDRGTYRMGGKGGRMAQAWQYVWDHLDTVRWTEALPLAKRAADAHDLKPVSVSEMLLKMRAAGVIEQVKLKTEPREWTRRGKTLMVAYPAVHYRIAPAPKAGCPECLEYAGTGGEGIACATCGKPGK